MADADNFLATIQGDDRLKARFHAASARVIADVKRHLNIELTEAQCSQLSGVQLATLTSEPISDFAILSEVHDLAGVAEQVAEADLRYRLEQGEESAHAEIAALPRADRMSRARQLGLTGETTRRDPTSVADEATLVRQCLSLGSPAARMDFARRHGIGGLS
ncbi:MAG: hypothetical protein JXQ91_13275 [Vannielia sp.]|uniref:hypothetical protein n=1 Tax=Vannielia sp. TaxID=2813045 RepID=UPI003B8DB478